MNNVRLFAALSCVAAFGLVFPREVSSLVQDNLPDIGIVVPVAEEVCPADKGDILVVYSAAWCGPCAAMAGNWPILRAQGYKVVYIDIDDPHKNDGRWYYQTTEIVAKAMEKRPSAVPTLRYYNSSTGEFLEKELVGLTTIVEVKEHLWKPSSSPVLVPELLRWYCVPAR